MYVLRKRHILPYCDDMEKDGRSVSDFIEEVEQVLHAMQQSDQDQYDFVMSLLGARPWKTYVFAVLMMLGLMICLSTLGRRLGTDAAHLGSCTVFTQFRQTQKMHLQSVTSYCNVLLVHVLWLTFQFTVSSLKAYRTQAVR